MKSLASGREVVPKESLMINLTDEQGVFGSEQVDWPHGHANRDFLG
jgi:hypothetical protein